MTDVRAVGTPDDEPGRPLLRVVRGNPDPAELAALVTVVSVVSAGAAELPRAPRSAWSDPARTLRPSTLSSGWRASTAPG